ncbi:MAG: aldo/keto reductase [Cohaesibacteraceae bacterium]|nr:aldo/keto reductase [Cohaesibacteraceae bacterium]
MTTFPPETIFLGKNLKISRVLTGLWQVADMEKDGKTLDPEIAADHLQAYADDGFTTFDMADHYGSSEIIAGRLMARYPTDRTRPLAFTKWCPEPGPMTAAVVRAGIRERLTRLGVEKLDLLQFHWWSFDHPGWLDALHELAELKQQGLIGDIGVTNFDAAHVNLALADGVPIISNQVSFSLIDRRATGSLAKLCANTGVQLLAYGTLSGGFLSQKWLGKPEPVQIPDWSGMKYKRFIDASGGWTAYQNILQTAAEIAAKHNASLSNVATRWVLEQKCVAGVIIGARIGENQHRADNVRQFGFSLDAEDHNLLNEVFSNCLQIPGDCGDEYRKPPFLTASGDLSDHLTSLQQVFVAEDAPGQKGRKRVLSGSEWEDIAGYCRAHRVGDRIFVSGTTATAGLNRVVAPGDAGAQTTFILDKIAGAILALGGTMENIVRTRIYLVDENDTMAVSTSHGRYFTDIKPANTLLVVQKLIGDFKVEIEAEAIVD